jgi:hypothetical protein
MCALLGACAARSPRPIVDISSAEISLNELGSDAIEPAAWVVSREPWSFASAAGEVIRTPNYRIYTTESSTIMKDRLSVFAEHALAHYRAALTPLPRPPKRLDTYLMDNRPQWVALTKRLLGAQSEPLLQIQRGGFASRGIGVYYDLGLYDTLAIAAHEGWHQYTQRTFADSLPIWLEEGIATFMEGHRWSATTPVFKPWGNIERFEHLRGAVSNNTLLPLEDLLANSPQQLLPRVDGSILNYYAQLWALVHFLNEGENGRYATSLRTLIADASKGELRKRLTAELGLRDARAAMASRTGTLVFGVYFDVSLREADAQYKAFVDRIIAQGSRTAIAAGRSPLHSQPNRRAKP